MGIYTDLLNNAKTWDGSDTAVAISAGVTKEIKRFRAVQGDPDIAAPFSEANEVQTIEQFSVPASSGNFTLTFDLFNDDNHATTTNIAWDADAATIQTSINNAVSVAYPAMFDSTIAVSLTTNLNEGDATLTFNGSSLQFQKINAVEITDVDLDQSLAEQTVVVTHGQPDRICWAAMNAMGLVVGDPPPLREVDIPESTVVSTRHSSPVHPRQETLQALALQAAIEDGEDELHSILLTAFGLGHLAKPYVDPEGED